jgi:hypothetical protein
LERCLFHARIDLGVSIGGVKADVAEPGSNHVHIDTSFQQMNCGRMAKEMGVETRSSRRIRPRVSKPPHDLVDPESR